MSVAKCDIDIKMDENQLSKFIETRLAIIKALNYTCSYYRFSPTTKGYHFWFKLQNKLTDKELADLQFLLGDDQIRAKFNYIREQAGVFNKFNALFSKKKRKKTKKLKYKVIGFLARVVRLIWK